MRAVARKLLPSMSRFKIWTRFSRGSLFIRIIYEPSCLASRRIASITTFCLQKTHLLSNMQKMHIASSDKPSAFYSLDVVISVGYRVNSKVATRFRQWANRILKAYIDQGYVINEKALRESPDKLNKLAAEVRALRSSEK